MPLIYDQLHFLPQNKLIVAYLWFVVAVWIGFGKQTSKLQLCKLSREFWKKLLCKTEEKWGKEVSNSVIVLNYSTAQYGIRCNWYCWEFVQ